MRNFNAPFKTTTSTTPTSVTNKSCVNLSYSNKNTISNNTNDGRKSSFTNDETRHLSGFVAKTRAFFENKENLNGCLNTKQTQNKSTSSIAKQSHSVTNIYSILNSNQSLNNSKLDNQIIKTQQTSDEFLLKPPILNKSISCNFTNNNNVNTVDSNRYKLNQSLSNSSLSSSTNSSQKLNDDIISYDLNIVDYNNLKQKTTQFKPVIQKFKKFNINLNQTESPPPTPPAIPPPPTPPVVKTSYEYFYANDHNHTNIQQIDKFDFKVANVKEVKKSFEFNLKSDLNLTNKTPQPQQQQPSIKLRDYYNHNHHEADNASTTSASSSISSFSSNSSSLMNANSNSTVTSQYKLKKRNFDITQSNIPKSTIPVPYSTSQTMKNKDNIPSCYKLPPRSTPPPSSSSSSSSSRENTPRDNSSNIKTNNEGSNSNLAISPKYKHKIIKLENNVSHFAKEVMNENADEIQQVESSTKSTVLQNGNIHSPRFSLLQKQLEEPTKIPVASSLVTDAAPKSYNKIQIIHTEEPLQPQQQQQLQRKTNFTHPPTLSKLPIKMKSEDRLSLSVGPTYTKDTNILNNNKKDELEKKIDNASCVLPSKYRNRSISLVDPKQMQMATSTVTKKVVRSPSTAKEALLRWCRKMTQDYTNVRIDNFSSSWGNGLAFCALIHHFLPDAYNYGQLQPTNRRYNFELAFKTAEDVAGIVPLLDVEDMIEMGDSPDWKCVFTYVHSIYQRFKEESLLKNSAKS